MSLMPNNVIIEILSYLEFCDLKNVLLTSKKFNKIISDSDVLMDKIYLMIGDEMKTNMTRKYRNVVAATIGKKLEIYKQLETISQSIVVLICNFVIGGKSDWKNINKLLSSTINLKRLELNYISLKTITIRDFGALHLQLPKLQLDSLTIHDNDVGVTLELLRDCSVKKLYIKYEASIGKALIVAIKNFFLKHSELELFSIFQTCTDVSNAGLFEFEDIMKTTFMLKHLHIQLHGLIYSKMENFKTFLQHQTNLFEISLARNFHDCVTNDETEIMNIFGQIQQITKVTIMDIKFNFNPMQFVETLRFIFIKENPRLRNFNMIFPNVKNLTMYENGNLKFVEQLTEPEPANHNEMIISSVKSLTLIGIDFKNENPFAYKNVKVQKLKLDGCERINWLFEYLRTGAKFNCLELKDIQISQTQHKFLESLNRGSEKQINELKLYVPMEYDANGAYNYDYSNEN